MSLTNVQPQRLAARGPTYLASWVSATKTPSPSPRTAARTSAPGGREARGADGALSWRGQLRPFAAPRPSTARSRAFPKEPTDAQPEVEAAVVVPLADGFGEVRHPVEDGAQAERPAAAQVDVDAGAQVTADGGLRPRAGEDPVGSTEEPSLSPNTGPSPAVRYGLTSRARRSPPPGIQRRLMGTANTARLPAKRPAGPSSEPWSMANSFTASARARSRAGSACTGIRSQDRRCPLRRWCRSRGRRRRTCGGRRCGTRPGCARTRRRAGARGRPAAASVPASSV